MKAKFPDGYGEYNEYDFDNRISYDEETDVMYIYVAPPQGQVGSVMVYSHNAVSVIVKGVEGGFTAGVARDVFESTGLRQLNARRT